MEERHLSISRSARRPVRRWPALGGRFSLAWLVAVLAMSSVPAIVLAKEPFDHGRWNRIIEANVTEEGWVDYRALREEKWRSELDAYLRELAALKAGGFESRADEKAFWINAYNAVCVKMLLDHDLPDEVPHATFFGANIFTEEKYRIAGKIRSLDAIEHEILRKKFSDPRVHAAIVCGASSCPRLRPEAFTGKDIDRQLDEECKRWIQVGVTKKGERKNRLDRDAKTYWASKIFDWYEEDFGDSDEGILRFIAKYASEGDREFLQKNGVRLRFLDYDWHLNSQDGTVRRERKR